MSEKDSEATTASTDPVFDVITKAVGDVIALDGDPKKADAFVNSLSSFIESLKLPEPPTGDSAESRPDKVTTPLLATLQLSKTQSEMDFGKAEGAAAGELRSAAGSWKVASQTYATGQIIAKGVLDEAIKDAVNTYDMKRNDGVRNQHRYAIMMIAVTAAVTTYETTIAQLGSTMAGAAGALLGAYATYAASVITADATLRSANAAAEETFWGAVETGRDAV